MSKTAVPSLPGSATGGATDSHTTRNRLRRRRLVALAVGIALAATLAAILVTGVSSSPPSTDTPVGDTAAGINAADAALLDLNVIPADSAPAAPNFTLIDQHGTTASLDQLRGKVVIWSLNDDQCTDLCALFAQDVIAADRDLGRADKDVVFLSVNANPFYPSPAAVKAWSIRNDLEGLANWVYVTGTPAQLENTWNAYHVTVIQNTQARTVAHDATIEFISPTGQERAIGDFAQGSISTAYYAHTMAQMADDLLPTSEQVKVGGTAVNAAVTNGATIGDPAPGFSLINLASGHTSSLASFETKPLVLNFWSSTCSICLQEMPALQQVDSDFNAKVNFVGVDVADPRTTAASFAQKLGVRYALLADKDGTVGAEYRVDALPVTFIIAPGGSILARHEGALTSPELIAVLDMDFQNLPQLGS